MIPYRTSRINTPKTGPRLPVRSLYGLCPTGYPIPASWSEKSVTQCPTFRYAPHIGKLPLAAALSPIL